MADRSGVSGYLVAPGSLVDLLGAGASLLYPIASESPVRAVFDVSVDPNSDGALIFDGRFSFGPDGSTLPSETVYSPKKEEASLVSSVRFCTESGSYN